MVNIPAYGFLRGLWIEVILATGLANAATTYLTDGFHCALSSITLQDTSGNPIYGPVVQGGSGTPAISAFIQKYGGYGAYMDPVEMGLYVEPSSWSHTAVNLVYWYYIPIELISRNGLGSITNLNAAAAYQLLMTVAPAGNITGTLTDLPTYTVNTYFDAWSQPPAHDSLGNQTTQRPPALNTTQFWTVANFPISAGYQKIQLTRLGYYIRELILIFMNSSGVRSDVVPPNQIELWKDNQPILQQDAALWRTKMYRDYGYSASGFADGTADSSLSTPTVPAAGVQDTGVFVVNFNDDFGLLIGDELRNGYLPTLQSTKLEVRGTMGTGATTLYVLTNDVAPPDSNESIFIPVTL